jgi:nitrate/nitrite-specific signal transduction histidine kinase
MTSTADATSAANREALILARPALGAVAAGLATAPHQVTVDCDPALRLPAPVVDNLSAIVLEAVDNALRHAFPNHIEGRVWVRLFNDHRGRLTLTIRDNGIGMPDFADYGAGGRARIFKAAAALHAYARMGAAPFGGGLVSITCSV